MDFYMNKKCKESDKGSDKNILRVNFNWLVFFDLIVFIN